MSKIKKQATVRQSVPLTTRSHKQTCSHCLQLPPFPFDDTIGHHSGGNQSLKTQRTSNRFKTRGIVVFSVAGKPAVANINDIAAGGVSFLYSDEIDINSSILTMDILIFDSQTKFEYLIPQINGQMTSRTSALAPKCNAQCWRYGVEFIEFDRSKKTLSAEIIPPEIKPHPSIF
ncbi:hypothetical protein [Desulforhopalus sp. IMCC35007]|uniref:hypothetical protein n=1 Tax=Desulforhopalus sp. IMCC35007 TaxID=2569543 RepID=UPI0010AED852|nr:hypothetical protein [Desulforhopalus sp. IMCC35007]TKB06984.1 hypothetical protein FCL48_18430 [Desulforhopalus sp. IMCC35007]